MRRLRLATLAVAGFLALVGCGTTHDVVVSEGRVDEQKVKVIRNIEDRGMFAEFHDGWTIEHYDGEGKIRSSFSGQGPIPDGFIKYDNRSVDFRSNQAFEETQAPYEVEEVPGKK